MPYNELERAVSGLHSWVMKVAVDTDPLLVKPATGCGGVVDDAVAAAASNGHPWNPVPHLRAMWFRSDSGRADSSAPLDGLRALAFLWVVQYHVSLAITDANTGLPILNALVWQGSCGVSLFFVLSGFLVGRVFDRLLARKDAAFRPAYGTFLYRRFVRIWPALMASVLVVQLYATARNFPDDAWWSACGTNELAGALLRNGLFLFDTSAVFVDAPGCVVNQVTWSVSCEFQYYLLTPFFIYAYRHSSKLAASGAVVVALVASLAYRAVVLARHPSWTESNPWNDPRTFGASDAFELAYVSAWGRGAEYCCGILAFFAADALEDRPDARRALFRPLSQAAVFGTWAVVQVYGLWYRLAYLDDFHASWEIFDFVFGFFLVAAVAAYVVVDVVGGESRGFLALLRRCLAAGCFYPIASVSYTGYLFQYAAIMQFKIAPDVLDATASVWAYYAVVSHATFACCAVGLVASLLVERPAMAVGKLLEGGASTPPKTPRRPATARSSPRPSRSPPLSPSDSASSPRIPRRPSAPATATWRRRRRRPRRRTSTRRRPSSSPWSARATTTTASTPTTCARTTTSSSATRTAGPGASATSSAAPTPASSTRTGPTARFMGMARRAGARRAFWARSRIWTPRARAPTRPARRRARPTTRGRRGRRPWAGTRTASRPPASPTRGAPRARSRTRTARPSARPSARWRCRRSGSCATSRAPARPSRPGTANRP